MTARHLRMHFRIPRQVFLLALLAGGAAAAAEPPLRVSFDPVVAPLAYLDEAGRPAGFAADYVQAVGKRVGREIAWVTGAKEFLWTEFAAGRIDAVAVVVFSEERAAAMDFSLPYLTLDGAVFARKGTAPVQTPADLRGRRVAVSRGNITHDYLRARETEWGIEIVPRESTEAALQAVQDGDCDASFNIDLVARRLIATRGLDRVVRSAFEPPGLVYKYHLAVRRGEAALLRDINEAQFALWDAGEYAQLHERWIGPLRVRALDPRELLPYLPALAALAALVATALVWQRRNLRRLARQADALRRSEEQLNLVLESGRHALWDWDVADNRVQRSPLLAQILGYPAEGIAPTPQALFDLLHPDSRADWAALCATIERPGQDDFLAELRLRTRDGGWRWIATAGRVLQRGPDGVARRAVGTHTDVTARRTAEEEARRLNLQLEQRVAERTAELTAINAELEAFSYSVSHDLRAPLRNIVGFHELLSRRTGGRIDAESDRFIRLVTAEATRMARLIDELLAFSRIGRAALARQPVALDGIVADVRAELEADAAGRTVEWAVGPLPAVLGDPVLLRQVFANLLGNAVKFTRRVPVARIEVAAETTADGEVTVRVRDNGAGFNPKYQDKLFGVFQRLHNAREFEGTGIGLANVKRIVARHGGRIWAEGAVGQGATFRFSLQLAPG